MTTIRVEAQGEATSTYVSVEQIVSVDFYTTGARNLAHAMVHMPDGNSHRVEGSQALALEKWFARLELKEER